MSRSLVALSALFMSLSVARAAEAPDIVAPLLDQAALRGCQWNASAPDVGTGFIFLAEYDDSQILMNLDGVDTALELVSDIGSLRPGAVRERRYRAPDVEVVGRFTSTWVCPAGTEGCEVTRYDVNFEVRKDSRVQHVDAAGEMGC